MADEKGKVTFGFSKKVKPSLTDSVIREETSKDDQESTDFVLSISGKRIKSTVSDGSEKKNQPLVIPLIVKNNWRIPSTAPGSKVKSDLGNNNLESQAVREILEDVRRNADNDQEDDKKESTMVIPLYMQNRVPSGFETDDRLDVGLRAEESTLDEYDDVPIEEFGLAMLRGMGWKPGEGIGAKNKRFVAPCEVVLRPKGLGLGANPRLKLNNKQTVANDKEKESKALVVGAFVKILSGNSKGLYGEVKGLDFDNARVIVKLTLSSETITISELYVLVVSKSEYKTESKLINKAKYDEYKAKEESKHNTNGHSEESKSSKTKSHSNSHRNSSPDSESTDHKRKHSQERKKESKKHVKNEQKSQSSKSWVYPLLRVRFIDKKYKNGQFYNSKIIIDDVVNKKVCICRTDSGRILEDIPQDWLETLIPKSSPAIVMIVQGSNRGQLGEILDRDKKKCMATVQLLQEKSLLRLDYDSICEYAGKISEDY